MKALRIGVCLAVIATAAACATGNRAYTPDARPDTIIYAVADERDCTQRLQVAQASEANDETVVVQPRRLCMTHTQILVRCNSLRILAAQENLARIDMRSSHPQADAYSSGHWSNGMGAITMRIDPETREFCRYVQREYQRTRLTTEPAAPAAAPG